MQSASNHMRRVLDAVPLHSSEGLGWTSLTALRWRHGELHDRTSAMSEHVVMAYLRHGGAITRQIGRRREAGVMRAGSVTVIPSGQEAYWDLSGSVDIVHAYVRPAILQAFADEHDWKVGRLRERLAFEDARGARILELLASELLQTGRSDRLFSEQLCGLLCTHLLRHHTDDARLSEGRAARGGLAPWQIARAEELVCSSLDQDLGLERLSGAVGLSPFHFARMFKVSTGLPPHAWVIQKRIGRARELLSETSTPVSEVAASVGYDDPSYFARLFKRMVGVAPMNYRNARRN